MDGVRTIGGPAMPAQAGRVATGNGAVACGFALAADGTAGARASAAVPASASVLDGMLALQEAGTDAVRDRDARRRGQDILVELARLQLALLAGAEDPDLLQRLGTLAAAAGDAADPALRDVLDSIVLRARVEVARRGR